MTTGPQAIPPPLLIARFLFMPLMLFRLAQPSRLTTDCDMDHLDITEPEDLNAEYQSHREQQSLAPHPK